MFSLSSYKFSRRLSCPEASLWSTRDYVRFPQNFLSQLIITKMESSYTIGATHQILPPVLSRLPYTAPNVGGNLG